jgi:hypothetical protein
VVGPRSYISESDARDRLSPKTGTLVVRYGITIFALTAIALRFRLKY